MFYYCMLFSDYVSIIYYMARAHFAVRKRLILKLNILLTTILCYKIIGDQATNVNNIL